MLSFAGSDEAPPEGPEPQLTESSFGADDGDRSVPRYEERMLQVDEAARAARFDEEDMASAQLAGGCACFGVVVVVGGLVLSFRTHYAARNFDWLTSVGHGLLAVALLGVFAGCGA